ncbi:MAG: GntP family permease [Planctomycetaceae bacterium]|jgi:GntP family gluconate:H+ symporter|nr:GntP family permease [Planctomycetaceae bacterium]
MEISAWGAIGGLVVAIILIVFRVVPAYSLIAGAFIGGLLGGADPQTTIKIMISGAQGIIPATMRIVTAGVLVGILIESGATSRIAATIIRWFGSQQALLALAIATMFLTAVGVFIDIAVLTVAPIALEVARETGYSRFAVLFAMIGGGKAGNVISPNPNTIAAAEKFNLELPTLMAANIIPAIIGLAATIIIANQIRRFQKQSVKNPQEKKEENSTVAESKTELPSFGAAIVGPLTAILLLVFRPVSEIFHWSLFQFDPLIALPIGGVVGCLAMGKHRLIGYYMAAGLNRMSGVAILLLGTGTIAGIIGGSTLTLAFQNFLATTGLPGFMLAPISGILMSGATASTTAGTAVAASTFHDTLIVTMGVAPLAAAAMIHAGATVLDHLPHGSFFHVTGGSVGMTLNERLRLIPLETAIGFVLVTVSTLLHGFLFR